MQPTRWPMQPARWAAAIVLAVAVAACTNTTGKPGAGGTPTDSGGTTDPAGTGRATASGATTGTASPPPTGARRQEPTLTSGTAHLKISGGYSYEKDLPFDPDHSTFSAPPANSGLAWRNTKGEQMGLFGQFKSGKTSDKMSLNASVPELQFAGASKNGECTVTFTSATADRVSGSYNCPNWNVDGKTVTVTGTFDAS